MRWLATECPAGCSASKGASLKSTCIAIRDSMRVRASDRGDAIASPAITWTKVEVRAGASRRDGTGTGRGRRRGPGRGRAGGWAVTVAEAGITTRFLIIFGLDQESRRQFTSCQGVKVVNDNQQIASNWLNPTSALHCRSGEDIRERKLRNRMERFMLLNLNLPHRRIPSSPRTQR